MTRYRLILFDLDGTLTDPKVGITKSVQYALGKIGIDAPSPDELTAFIGPPLHVTFAQRFQLPPATVTQAVTHYREHFSAHRMYENQLYPRDSGIAQSIARLVTTTGGGDV